MNYKEVFQLAQEKGYKRRYNYTNYNPPNAEYSTWDENTQLLELTLIQKWLRDEKKILVEPLFNLENCNSFLCVVYQNNRGKELDDTFATYEQALLEGIAEALKLIS